MLNPDDEILAWAFPCSIPTKLGTVYTLWLLLTVLPLLTFKVTILFFETDALSDGEHEITTSILLSLYSYTTSVLRPAFLIVSLAVSNEEFTIPDGTVIFFAPLLTTKVTVSFLSTIFPESIDCETIVSLG